MCVQSFITCLYVHSGQLLQLVNVNQKKHFFINNFNFVLYASENVSSCLRELCSLTFKVGIVFVIYTD